MKVSGERYFPQINNAVLGPCEPFISYEHWHRYCYAVPFVKGKTVLDIASGEGYGSAILAKHSARVYGVDVSEEAVRHARRTYVRDNLQFLQGSAGEIPIPGQHCIDTIVSFETIEHLDAPTQERFVREANRLLKPEGVLLISTPNRTVYSEAVDYHNPFHLREFTGEEFLHFLQGYFKHVNLLSQHLYPMSYIWNVGDRSPEMVEYQMSLEGERFQPGETDGKEVRYLIAVCTNRESAVRSPDSMLLDLTEIAFRGVPGRERWHESTLYPESGQGFRWEDKIAELVEYRPDFRVTFTLDPSISYREVRWDPVELHLCKLRLRSILWQDGASVSHQLDLNQINSNGERLADGSIRFDNIDPLLYLPIAGSVASITIEGECVVENNSSSLHGMDALLRRRNDELNETRNLLADRDRYLLDCEQQLRDYAAAARSLPPPPPPSWPLNWLHSVLALVSRRPAAPLSSGNANVENKAA